jgi:chromate reductase, NAD(P)H dehydrogenase (quinone)
MSIDPSAAPAAPLRVLVLAGSRRAGSLNRQLASLAAELARAAGAEVDHAELREFDVPLYDGDDEAAHGVPAGALELGRRLARADAFILSSPEYNFSMPGVVKNLIDWTSRIKPSPLAGQIGLLLSASPSMVGGNRALWALRVPLESQGVRLHPDMFSLAQAHQAFDGGALKDEKLQARLRALIEAFLGDARALRRGR